MIRNEFKIKEKYSKLLTFYLTLWQHALGYLTINCCQENICPAAVEQIINIVLLWLLFLLLFSGFFCYTIRYLPKQIVIKK